MVRISGGGLKISFRTKLHKLYPSPLRESLRVCYNVDISRIWFIDPF